jgi:predicted MFS family arabinose efflux permease
MVDVQVFSSQRSAAWAIFGIFFFESAVIGQWIPRIPDIKDALTLSDSQLGLALLSLPLGTLIGFAIAGRIIHIIGLRTACRIFLPLWAVIFIFPGFANSLNQLMLALLISGFAVGMIETAMNTEAARIEKAQKKRLMSRCHGFWSLGTMLGALTGGLIAQKGISVAHHFLAVMPLIGIAGFTMASLLPVLPANEKVSLPSDENAKKLFTFPNKSILLLCIMPLGIMMVEGAFIDWSAVFMRDVMAASPWTIAITYAFFSSVMAATRLSGDYITARFGELRVVYISALAATAGVALFALAPGIVWVFIGAALSGAGVAIVFPLAVTAAANRPGRSAADNVAALNMVAFSAFLVAPALIGFLSEAIGLRYALLVLAPLAFTTFLLAAQVEPYHTGKNSA